MMAKGRAPKGRSKGRTVKDYQRGNAANGYEVEVGGEAGEGHNSEHFEPNGKALKDFLELVAGEQEVIKTIMEAARKKCEGPRTTIAKAKKVLIESGYEAQVLTTLMRKDRLQRQVESVHEKLNDDQQLVFRSFERSLGEFADTPLGQATVAAEAASLNA